MKHGMRIAICCLALAMIFSGCSGKSYEEPRQTIPAPPIQTEPPAVEATQAPELPAEKATEAGNQQEVIYQAAVTLLEQGFDRRAAGALMLTLGYEDSEQLLEEITRSAIAENAETFSYIAAVREDGTVAPYEYAEVDVSGWTDVVSVSGGYDSLAALRNDGTLLVSGSSYEDVQAIAQSWDYIVDVCCGYDEIVALRADGTVLSTDPESPVNDWTDVVRLEYDGMTAAGVTAEGMVLCDSMDYDVSDWKDITDIALGMDFILGLRKDGTVVGTGLCADEVAQWEDIVAIDAYNTAMGLRADGTVVLAEAPIAGWGIDIPDLSGWRNVAAIDTWGLSFLGLRADGTLLADGLDEGGQLNVGYWRNVVEVKVENYMTFALCADGTVLGTGVEEEVRWTDILIPEEKTAW